MVRGRVGGQEKGSQDSVKRARKGIKGARTQSKGQEFGIDHNIGEQERYKDYYLGQEWIGHRAMVPYKRGARKCHRSNRGSEYIQGQKLEKHVIKTRGME